MARKQRVVIETLSQTLEKHEGDNMEVGEKEKKTCGSI